MNAIEYFKNNGLLKSKMHLGVMNAENWHNEFYSDLKQIVEAFELVNLHGSLKLANHYAMKKTCLSEENTVNDLWDAINLVEKCNASD